MDEKMYNTNNTVEEYELMDKISLCETVIQNVNYFFTNIQKYNYEV